MAKVQYLGTSNVRILEARDFKTLGIEGGSKTTWVGSQPQDLPDEVANALVERLPKEFQVLEDDNSNSDDEGDELEVDDSSPGDQL